MARHLRTTVGDDSSSSGGTNTVIVAPINDPNTKTKPNNQEAKSQQQSR